MVSIKENLNAHCGCKLELVKDDGKFFIKSGDGYFLQCNDCSEIILILTAENGKVIGQ